MGYMNDESKLTFLRDGDWSQIDGEICRVSNFVPLGSKVQDGKVIAMDSTTPYASINFECKKFSGKATGFITHKIDFKHLWLAFKERRISGKEEILIIWTTKQYKSGIFGILPAFPKLWVMICPKGAFELMTNSNHKPELTGEARARAMSPIEDWKPDIMK